MIEIKNRLLPLVLIIALSGCRSSNPASPLPAHTNTHSNPILTITQSPTPSPSSTPAPTPSPRPILTMSNPSAPPGLIYCSNDELWATRKDGTHIFLVPDCRADFSSEYQYVFYGKSGEYYIIDMFSGETILSLDLWDQENDPVGVDAISIRSATWSSDNKTIYCSAGRFMDWFQDIWSIDVESGKFINLSNTEDRIENSPYLFENQQLIFSSYFYENNDQQPNFSGYLTLMDRDGSNYLAYSANESGIFTISPDGTMAAIFGGDLFTIDNGFIHLEPSILNRDQDLVYQLVYPSWSLDSRYISWSVETTQNGKYVTGFGIHDIEHDTIDLFYPFRQIDGEGPPFPPEWSPDGNWLTLSTMSMESQSWGTHVIDINGEEVAFFQQIFNIVWSPSTTKMLLNSGHLVQSGRGVWIADFENLNPQMIDLPGDAVVVEWIDPDIVQSWFDGDS